MKSYLYKEMYELGNKHWWFLSKKKIILSMIKKYIPKNKEDIGILDIGCGSGLMLKDLEEIGKVYGLDSSDEAIKFSSQKFNGIIKKGSLPDDIPYPNERFDIITVLDVLEHIEKDKESIGKIKNLLKDNGIFVITIPANMYLWSNHDNIHNHLRRYTKDDLYKKIILSGFKIEKISYYNSLLYIPIYLARKFNNIFRKNKVSSDLKLPCKVVNFILKTIFSLEEKYLGKFNFSQGVSLIAVCRK